MGPTECWVIFDTYTRQLYYQDVHNLLALPSGSILRYEYRKQRLSQGAIAAANRWQKWDPVLLVYAQWHGYAKRDPDPTVVYPFAEMLWVPTRLATMRGLRTAPGDVFYFDLLLGAYPDVDDPAIMAILADLYQLGDVPYLKWVATAEELPTTLDDVEDRWNKIIDRLGVAPSQFANDTFWRLQAQEPRIRGDKSAAYSYYVIHEPERLRLTASTYTPQKATAQGALIPNRSLGIILPADSPVNSEQPLTVPLRPYTGQDLTFRANRSELLDDRVATMQLTTTPDDDGWASGPNLNVRVEVRKRAWKLVAGTVLLLVGLLIGGDGVRQVLGASTLMGFAAVVIGALAIAAGTLMLTGKLALKI